MSFLVLSDNEVALLRFTCDLFFVEESPLWFFEGSPREPADFAAAYHALVERSVVDPREFRMTDAALNRVAPVTECDARIVHLVQGPGTRLHQTDYYLLDEIAVEYQRTDDGRNVFGRDADDVELVARLARCFVPRRATGEGIDIVLAPMEFVALSHLLAGARQTGSAEMEMSLDDAHAALGRPPDDDALLAGHQPVLLLRKREGPSWAPALRGLADKRLLVLRDGRVRLSGLLSPLLGTRPQERHTIVRSDFREDDWAVREITLIPHDGGVFLFRPERGGTAVVDLDGAGLRAALERTITPYRSERASPRRIADLLVGLPRRA